MPHEEQSRQAGFPTLLVSTDLGAVVPPVARTEDKHHDIVQWVRPGGVVLALDAGGRYAYPQTSAVPNPRRILDWARSHPALPPATTTVPARPVTVHGRPRTSPTGNSEAVFPRAIGALGVASLSASGLWRATQRTRGTVIAVVITATTTSTV